MLLQFAVENFLSIKDEVVLDFSATSDKSLPDNLLTFKDKQFLKSIGIFGANASGKSNVLKALATAINLLRLSNNRQIGEPLPGIVPFKFAEDMLNKPSTFKFTFVAGGYKYFYAFSATREKVYEEVLYKYLSSKPTKIFERSAGDKYAFNLEDKSKLAELAEKNTPNKFFLATATTWNYAKTREAYLWFQQDIDVVNWSVLLQGGNMSEFANDATNKLKNLTLTLLKEADINIDDYTVRRTPLTVNDPRANPQLVAMMKANGMEKDVINHIDVLTGHTVVREGKAAKKFNLLLQEESEGTVTIFMLAPVLAKVFALGSVLCVDEIETHFHPDLVAYLVGLFHNPKLNTHQAQLLFTTHDVNMMDLDFLRRDQFYFTQKDGATGETELYSLAEFSVRKSENIRKAYLAGRFGAVPTVGTGGAVCL